LCGSVVRGHDGSRNKVFREAALGSEARGAHVPPGQRELIRAENASAAPRKRSRAALEVRVF